MIDVVVVVGVAAFLVGQFSALWYKLGRVERMLENHCRYYHHKEEN